MILRSLRCFDGVLFGRAVSGVLSARRRGSVGERDVNTPRATALLVGRSLKKLGGSHFPKVSPKIILRPGNLETALVV